LSFLQNGKILAKMSTPYHKNIEN